MSSTPKINGMTAADTNDCPSPEELRDFNAGHLSADRIDRIGEHLCNCAKCLSCLDQMNSDLAEVLTSHNDDQQLAISLSDLLNEAEFREFETRAKAAVPHDQEAHDQEANATEFRLSDTADSAGQTRIGKYELIREIGSGGFARVYLGRDTEENRQVAIKLPLHGGYSTNAELQRFFTEARAAAALRHHGIVPVYDWGCLDSSTSYVVMKYIEGRSLRDVIAGREFSERKSAELVARVAEALHHAHKHNLVHRDIKPANILLDQHGNPVVVDFGLAIHDEQRWVYQDELAGTRPYKAPEQIRLESHRLDGRTDIWSLGVVFYELLTGRRPFTGDNLQQLDDEIQFREPRPPRQTNDAIAPELERICLKCLSKRMTDRYTTGIDLARDLESYLAKPSTPQQPVVSVSSASVTGISTAPRIIPKGIRPYDAHDAGFFLGLVPGPRDRNQLPESVRFWKTRIEERDGDQTFSLGVLYGPSGCGKSSLVRAGILPLLSEDVQVVFVEAAGDDTPTKILKGIHKVAPTLSDLDLNEALAAVRRGEVLASKRKMLIVIDQFEQWLHAASPEENARLAGALRQCDGGNLQCLVLVRDEFWLAISRLFRELEIPIVEGQNSALVDLFDTEHAQRVLAEFGRAFRRLPEPESDLSPGQKAFIRRAVGALAQDGKVNCLRLALFADMMKGTPWLPENLTQMGGIEGVGIAFLEATFSGPTAPPECRLYERAARAVLMELLPAADSNIRGHSQSYLDLQRASGCGTDQFDRLIHLLDSETRLITPTDPAISDAQADPLKGATRGAGPKSRHYQLTHDYLVPSVRAWLTRRQRETRVGRAELMLAERAQLWESRRESRQLPTLLETLTILLLTKKSAWSEAEQRTMEAAGQLHARRLLAGVMIVVGSLLVVFVARRELDRDQRLHEAKQLVHHMLTAELSALPEKIDALQPYQGLVFDQLEDAARTESIDRQLRAQLALVRSDPSRITSIISMMDEVPLQDLIVLRDALNQHAEESKSQLWQAIQSSEVEDSDLLPLAYQLAYFDAESKNWPLVASRVAQALFDANHLDVGHWTRSLEPAGPRLIGPLESVFRDEQASSTDRVLAADILASFASDQPERIVSWIVDANPDQFHSLLHVLELHREPSGAILIRTLSDRADDPSAVSKITRAAAALMHLGYEDEVWNLFRTTMAPDLRTSLIRALYEFGVPADTILEHLKRDQEPSIQHALMMALHDYPRSVVDARPELVDIANRAYSSSPSSGVHSASESLLRQWEQEQPTVPPNRYTPQAPNANDWWVTPFGHTMILMRAPISFVRGSPEHETGRDPIEYTTSVELKHSFALAAHEVSVAQYLKSNSEFQYAKEVSATEACPINKTSWYDAIKYCRWLSEQEGVSEDQMCYPPVSEIGEGMKLLAEEELLSRTGYRLPTDTEWEYAARAGSSGAWAFGNNPTWLRFYAMYLFNAEERAWPIGTARPNAFGFFNMHGNVAEWCQNLSDDLPISQEVLATQVDSADVNAGERVFRGGGYESRTKLTRSAKLYSYPEFEEYSFIGFRIARTVKQ